MLVYIAKGRKTGLSRMTVEGLEMRRLEVGRGFLARRRAVRLLEGLYERGVRRCVCADGGLCALTCAAGITPFSVLPLRLALLNDLLTLLCPTGLENGCAALHCGRNGEDAAWAVLPVLAARARYVRVEASHAEQLERELLYRWGIAAGSAGRCAAVTVLCGDDPPPPEGGAALWLTADCAVRQTLIWTARRASEVAVVVTEPLAAALVAEGKWQVSEIHITSLLDRQGENGYNAP